MKHNYNVERMYNFSAQVLTFLVSNRRNIMEVFDITSTRPHPMLSTSCFIGSSTSQLEILIRDLFYKLHKQP